MAIINGTAANDTLAGTAAADTINGLAGADTMSGGLGNDTYYVDDLGDVVIDTGGADTVNSSVSYTLGANLEHLTLIGAAAINGIGNTLNNTITGNAADNIIDGGFGVDTMSGGLGNDTYYVENWQDVVIENADAGIDTVNSSISYLPWSSYTLGENIENLTLIGTANNGKGNALNNIITGNATSNIIDGGAGADTMSGGLGGDTYYVDNLGDTVTENAGTDIDTVNSSISYTLGANLEYLTLIGTAAINGTGNELNNYIVGNDADNTIYGGAGADWMVGGLGNDTYYVDNLSDVVSEYTLGGELGIDTVNSSVSYTLGATLEHLTLIGAAAINGTGNELSNVIGGNAADNIINGLAGADNMTGGLGNDTYYVDDLGDVVTENTGEGIDTVNSSLNYTLGENVENLTLLDTAISGTGNELNNTITGTGYSNVIDGGAGADTMSGGFGDDIYIVDNSADVVVENTNSKKLKYGNDTVQTTANFNMATNAVNVENLWLMGTAAINGTGNVSNNLIVGNAADNVIDGGAGIDTASYQTASAGVTVNLGSTIAQDTLGEGIDTLLNIENLIGSSANDSLTGNTLDNILNGGAGVDVLAGGLGNDTYVVENINDVAIEAAGAGTDTVISSVNYTLGDNLENLTLNGAGLMGVGNALNNTYAVNGLGTSIVEAADGGIDTINSSVSYTLNVNVENLTLTGTAVINGTGNELNNTLTGNSAINTLTGGLGNDTYVVQNTGDLVIENAGEGNDTVWTTGAYTLSANVETLFMSGAGNGTGNAQDNIMFGMSSIQANVLAGGLGNDSYYLSTDSYYGYDTIVESANGGIDTLFSYGSGTLAANVENLVLYRTPNYYYPTAGYGNALDNVLDGTQDEVTSNLYGKTGNDTYLLREGDIAIESADEGIDTVIASVSLLGQMTLSDNVENLMLTVGKTANGSSINNTLIANDADNVLDGKAGADILIGKAGDDIYYVEDTLDTIVELAGEGVDLVFSAATEYTLIDTVENLTLISAAAINGTGNDFDNTLTGNSANNVLNGEDGNDVLNGGLGADTLIGDHGDDTFIVDNTGDIIIENTGEGIDTVQSYATDYALSANIENLTLITISDGLTYSISGFNGTGNDLDNILTGNGLYNTLIGGLGNDMLDGGAGVDRMYGGLGDDTYLVDLADSMHDRLYFRSGDHAYENANEGTDTIISSSSFSFTSAEANVENLTLIGSAFSGAGNALNNVLTGNVGNNSLDGKAGSDTMIGGMGDDIYYVDDLGDSVIEDAQAGNDSVQSSVSYTLSDNVENLVLTGADAINGIGNTGDNILVGDQRFILRSDQIILLAGATTPVYGANVLMGGLGNDDYVVDGLDTVVENADEGIDTLHAFVADTSPYTLQDNIENLYSYGHNEIAYRGSRHVMGNSLNNTIVLDESNLTTNFGHDDIIDGGIGADRMNGGKGQDTYYVDDIGDVVIESRAVVNIGDLNDTVISTVSYTLGANVENITLAGTENINATGNELDNVLQGNSGINILSGGRGNDAYVIWDSSDDVIVEYAGEGNDIVATSISYALVDNLEAIYLLGSGDINAMGNSLDNSLIGNSGANRMDGREGNDSLYTMFDGGMADTLIGGAGNDTYFVGAETQDTIIESQGQGVDTVWIRRLFQGENITTNYTLADNVENLHLVTYVANLLGPYLNGQSGGSNQVHATGNDLNNIISVEGWRNLAGMGFGPGNASDVIDGGMGADTMAGKNGNDLYYVDNVGDVVVESATGGTDTIMSSVSFDLSAAVNRTISAYNFEGYYESISTTEAGGNVENLTLSGLDNINGTGNALNNVITGNAGNNVLDGGLGNDTLNGGSGADTFVFNTALGATNVDSIVGFVTGSDAIQLDLVIFGGAGATGALSSTAFASGAGMTAAATVDQHIIYNSTSGGLFYDADGAGGVASVQFATLVGVPPVTDTDFIVV